ncbi:DPP IV N-terminal domain-containing protein [Chryseobacterium sp. CKR4-1]|uniref:S9 family peptidase n=1 Tax=Chryseobacterium sp. CKR4-1 TaxID=3068896 RepID=UPI0027968145|nr:DPP IV N-terminal domain-containing protein [Chryseobacterium sp. CKR4-1]MDQ1806238.1 DPP IV N-terminal domain-containing protein [Chryseobacterium sp. CKR4-1]
MKILCKYAILKVGLMIVFLVSFAHAQVSDTITSKGRYRNYLKFHSLIRDTYIIPHWYKDGSRFWFAVGVPENTMVYEVDPEHNTKRPFFDQDRLRKALTPWLDKEPENKGLPFSDFVFVEDDNAAEFFVEHKKFRLYLRDYKILKIDGKEEVRQPLAGILSPDGKQSVIMKDHNIWLISHSGQREQQLTTGGTYDYPWTVENGCWSKDGKRLLLKRSDGRKVHHLPVIDYSKPEESVTYTVYAKTGGAIEIPEMYVLDIDSGNSITIKEGSGIPQYVFPVGWTQEGSEVLFMRLDRLGKKLEFLATNPDTGAGRTILSEEAKTFVAGLDFLTGNWKRQVTLLKERPSFIWMSERDGWRHLYLYSMDGKLVRQLTSGNFPVTGVIRTNEKSGLIYFTANAEKEVYSTNVYSVGLNGKNSKRLTPAPGIHTYSQFSPSGKYFLDTHSSPDTAPAVELRTTDGKWLQQVHQADITKLQKIGFRAPEIFKAKAADGITDLYGIMYKPYDFDPSKKYPVVEMVYAGPFINIVPHRFGPTTSLSVQAQALAQLGYITVMMDTRGTVERSKAFQDAVYRNIGRYEIADRVAVFRQLGEKYSYMDMKRVGICGHSWGGYFAIRAMQMAPDLYKVGIASAPGELTEGAEINEPYMGLPEDNKEGYEWGTNTNHAANLKGKLLLIHGTSDINAPLSTTIRMIDALTKAGKRYDLILVPGKGHDIESEDYVNDAIRRYFEENLKNTEK